MISLRAPSVHRSLLSLRARSLTTTPKPIPSYIKVWNPDNYTPPQQKDPSPEWMTIRPTIPEEDARKLERENVRDVQRITVSLPGPKDALGWTYALKRLNDSLLLAEAGTADRNETRSQLWRAYFLAKRFAPELPSFLPDRAWDVLWATQSIRSQTNRSREAHLEELYHDMLSAGKQTTVGQRVEYLEGLFFNGKEDEALKEWELDHGGLTESHHDHKPEHLEAGARLHALAGNADRSLQVMEELFRLYPWWNPSIMMAVFRAHTSLATAQHHDLAKGMYLKMKTQMGSKVSLKDYDAWFTGFLEAKHVRYAKDVFRDMVKDGFLASAFSPEHVEKVLERQHRLYRLGTDIEKMTSIALHAISVLPKPYHSPLFGSWMKSAVVQKAPEAATQILDMMFRRGYKGETYHFNLLLKVLLRTKDEQRVLKAENIGWRMVEEARRSQIRANKVLAKTTAEGISENADRVTEPMDNPDVARKVPPANSGTFALMMRHHADNLQWEHVDYLVRRLREAEVAPNTAIMNVLMDSHARKGNYGEVFKTYHSLTDVPEGSPGVFPDGATFRCLWKTLRLALGDHATRDDESLPTPRRLLTEMLTWGALWRSRYDAERFRIGLAAADRGAITSLVMHCFSYARDLPGSLVALHALRHEFYIFPTNKAAGALQRQASWVDLQQETTSIRSQYHHSQTNKHIMEKMGSIYHILMNRRLERMNMTGDQYAYLSEEEVGDLGLNLLSEFVRVILKRQHSPEEVEAMIDEVRTEIGLPDLSTGDLDAFGVV